VIRIQVPPLRDRRDEIPHLSTFFLREACDRLGKPDVQLAPATLDLFARYWWPGNVRQLRNEIQRAVAMSEPGGSVLPDHLSPDLAAPSREGAPAAQGVTFSAGARNLTTVVEQVEKELIATTLGRTRGNISETARLLGLTRRGLYLKMRRLHLEGAMADTK
jgi:DNA-binding NtrC family response regulator